MPELTSNVLLVDDQQMIAEAVRRMLASEPDIQFTYCEDPLAAVDTATARQPTVILQDLIMPGMSGLTLLARYREEPATAGIPVIVLSSKEEATTKSEAFSAGASDYLVKLPDRIELVARIRLHSRARVHQLERDAAYRALSESQKQLEANNAELLHLNRKLAEASEALRQEAMHDSLSGLLNRRALYNLFEKEVLRARRHDAPIAVIMGDIDHFKTINDTHGHKAGDLVIQDVARRLCLAVRSTDLVARYGGEEFVVIAPDCNADDAVALAERFRTAISGSPISVHDGQVSVTMSLGVATALSKRSPDDLLRAADEALYRSKRGGRDKVELNRVA